jgi:hypothetical protein
MIVSYIKGGLGNQFFQYAMGRALALQRKTKLVLDLEWFDQQPPPPPFERPFELYRYGIKVRQLSPSERKWIQNCTTGNLKRFAFAHR